MFRRFLTGDTNSINWLTFIDSPDIDFGYKTYMVEVGINKLDGVTPYKFYSANVDFGQFL